MTERNWYFKDNKHILNARKLTIMTERNWYFKDNKHILNARKLTIMTERNWYFKDNKHILNARKLTVLWLKKIERLNKLFNICFVPRSYPSSVHLSKYLQAVFGQGVKKHNGNHLDNNSADCQAFFGQWKSGFSIFLKFFCILHFHHWKILSRQCL